LFIVRITGGKAAGEFYKHPKVFQYAHAGSRETGGFHSLGARVTGARVLELFAAPAR